jgi:hypothetical protein
VEFVAVENIRQALMEKHCPHFAGFSSDVGMLLAIATPQNNQVMDVECHAIAPATQQDLSPVFDQLLQKIDGQTAFVQQGFEHLIKQNQSFDQRLSQLERQPIQPVYQQPVQHQSPDFMPVFQQMYAQQQGMMQLAQKQNQTNLAVMQMSHAMQKLCDRPATPTTINHFVDNTTHNDNHSVTIHGDNYGNICTDGVQKNGGGFILFFVAMIGTIILGTQIYGK